jgi:predicted nuclease with TOPRIM domain
LVQARAEAASARVECLAIHEKLEEKKKALSEFEQRAKSAESEVSLLRKELNTTLTELSAERLCSEGFIDSMQLHAHDVFNDFRRVYEELGATLHPLDLEGEGLFDCWAAAWL